MVRSRDEKGSAHLSEFAAAIFLLLTCIVIPLIDLAAIPIRWALGRSIVAERVHNLAGSETLGAALEQFSQDRTLDKAMADIGGTTVQWSELTLTATSIRRPDQAVTVARSGMLPSEWLPDGARSPCAYQLGLTVRADIAPLIMVKIPNVNIPGLTRPLSIPFHDASSWENLGRDPLSGQFYVNE